jgi:hypothetical protein
MGSLVTLVISMRVIMTTIRTLVKAGMVMAMAIRGIHHQNIAAGNPRLSGHLRSRPFDQMFQSILAVR